MIAVASRPLVNRVLASMPADVQQRLISLGARAPIQKSAVLAEAGVVQTHVYFPDSGLLSLQTMTQDGYSVEVTMVGREGFSALPVTSGSPAAYTTVVTVPGDALRLQAAALEAECERCPPLQRLLMQGWHSVTSEIASGSACHRFHSSRQRLARWLLAASDRIQSSRLELTHEQLGAVLGLQRTRVTTANIVLQDAGAIASRHGRIRILDRARLRDLSCECYTGL
jgi:CRP-like cAMP-binding protein